MLLELAMRLLELVSHWREAGGDQGVAVGCTLKQNVKVGSCGVTGENVKAWVQHEKVCMG